MPTTFSRNRGRAGRVAATAGTVAVCTALLAAASGPAIAQPGPAAAVTPAATSGHVRSIPFTEATVTPAGGGRMRVAWSAPSVHDVVVLAGTDAAAQHRIVGTGGGTGELTVTGTSGDWFRLVPNAGQPLLVTTRDLGLASDPNLRDVGGYRTTDGRWVRMGVVYRSQALSLSAADRTAVAALGITDDYDLRTPAEAKATPDAVPAGATYTMLNVMGVPSVTTPPVTTPQQAQQYMADMERQFVTSPAARQAFGALLTGIADHPGAQLFHCTAGKDRTGWATAVLLTLLGVPQSTVTQDYLLSNDDYYESPAVQAMLASLPPAQAAVYEHFLDAEPAYVQAGFDQVRAGYGSMQAYATKGLGLSETTLATLRRKLLVGSGT